MTTIPNVSPTTPVEPQVPAFKGNSEQAVEKAPEAKNESHLLRNSLIALGVIGSGYVAARHGVFGKSAEDFVKGVKKGADDLTDAKNKTDTPADAPKTEAPKTEAPKTEAPKTEAPKTEAPKTEAPKTEAPKTEAPKTEAPKTEAPKAVEKLTHEQAAQKLYKEKLDFIVVADEKDVNKATVLTKKGKTVESNSYNAIRNKNGDIIGAEIKDKNKTTTFINGQPKKEVTINGNTKTTTVDGKSTTKSYTNNEANRAFTVKHADDTEVTTKLEYVTNDKGKKIAVAKSSKTTKTPTKDEKGKVIGSKTVVEEKEGKTITKKIVEVKGEKIDTKKVVTRTTNKGTVMETITDNGTTITKQDNVLQRIELKSSGSIVPGENGSLKYCKVNERRYFKKEGDAIIEYKDDKCENKLKTLYSAKDGAGKTEFLEIGISNLDEVKAMDDKSKEIFEAITKNI